MILTCQGKTIKNKTWENKSTLRSAQQTTFRKNFEKFRVEKASLSPIFEESGFEKTLKKNVTGSQISLVDFNPAIKRLSR